MCIKKDIKYILHQYYLKYTHLENVLFVEIHLNTSDSTAE